MTHPDLDTTLERLYRRRSFGIRPGLRMTARILEKLGDPQAAYRVVHVAGTNGKGSVSAILESMLRAAGLRTALYTSPHLVRFNERFRVDGDPIADPLLAEILQALEKPAAEAAQELSREATFFEYTTAAAFEFFRRAQVDIAVVETGMGGRLDATNVVKPELTVITRIGMDHTMYLGNTLEEIAMEKCGIIKPRCPLVSGSMDDEAFAVVARSASAAGVTHVPAAETVSIKIVSAGWSGQKVRIETQAASYGGVDFPLVGEHQVENLATAVAAAEALADAAGVPLREEHIRSGTAKVEWPGRCQVLREQPLVVLDGAHNPGGARVLARTVARLSKGCPLGLVVGMCNDKDVRDFLAEFPCAGGRLWAVAIDNERSMTPGELRSIAEGLGWQSCESDIGTALDEAERWSADTGGVACVTGSLFLAGEVLGMVDLSSITRRAKEDG